MLNFVFCLCFGYELVYIMCFIPLICYSNEITEAGEASKQVEVNKSRLPRDLFVTVI